MTSIDYEQIFSILFTEYDKPKSELWFTNNFELLVAVILSAQATDKSVNKVTRGGLFPLANTPAKMLKLGEIGLKNHIKSIGLYNNKAKNIIKTASILIEQHNSEVPSTRKELEALAGVGRKTANILLNVAFGNSTIAVDTHVFRIANRTGLASGKTPLQIEHGLLKITPKKYLKEAHHLLILHGRYVCIARKPKCETCIINKLCKSYNE
jgi:endonuclease-3